MNPLKKKHPTHNIFSSLLHH